MAVAPLSTIPNVYFEDDFRLENPRTFDIVSEKSEIAPSADGAMSPTSPGGSGKKALAANAILQEKLSWYMDTVEIHLISSISTASTSFFAALGSLRGLQEEAGDSVEKIRRLRKDLAELDQGMAVGGLEIITKKRRRENLRRLTDAVEQLELVARCISDCEEQVDSGDVEEALAGLTDVESLIAGEKPRRQKGRKHPSSDFEGALIDLSSIKALKEATQGIGLLRQKIGKAYEGKFMQVLLQDLKGHIEMATTHTTLLRLEKASNRLHGRQHKRMPSETENPAYQTVDPDFRAALRDQLKGLAKSESATRAVEEYRKGIVKEFKNIVRRHIPSSSEDDAESMASIATHDSRSRNPREKGAVLRQNLRAMDQDDGVEMLKNIYCSIAEGLRRLGTQSRELLDITSKLENPQTALSPRNMISPRSSLGGHPGQSIDERLNMKSPGTPPVPILHEEIQRALNIQSLLGDAVRLSEKHVKPVLRARVEQTTAMDLRHFLQYFTLNRLFADECEAVSGFGLPELKSIVNDHIKSFISHVAEDERKELVQKMDTDKWDARDFAEEHIERLKRIIQSGTSDIEEWTKLGSIFEESPETPKATQNGTMASEVPKDATPSKDKVRSAVVDDEKYILPESAMVVAGGIESFLKLLVGMESMGTEICSAMLDYIKLFNSRSSQLILGAGATRSAGLKNITTKHLALSSQGLSFVVAIIPYVREFARRHLPKSSALLTEFDKVKRLLQEHQSGIHDKLVEIMTGRATAHVNSMKKIEWDNPKATAEVNKYMETLMKETATLHKVLTRHLPDSSVAMIMQPVLAGYQDQWTKAFNSVEVKTTSGKERSVHRSLWWTQLTSFQTGP
jgi:vacuolar protein sorting-associated protein 54